MEGCPACGGSVQALGVWRHRWWVCSACGSASREPRRSEPEREIAYFRNSDPDSGVREVALVRGWLADAGIRPSGRVLDVGGGPGWVAADLAAAPDVTGTLLLEFSPHARAHADGLGVAASPFDFQGGELAERAPGTWNLLLVRYSLPWCLNLSRFAQALREVAAPDAALVVTWVLPGRGAFAISQFEHEAPDRLYSERFVDDTFAAAGWRLTRRFTPAAPMFHPSVSWRWLLGLPVLLRPGPESGFRQRHAGRVFAV